MLLLCFGFLFVINLVPQAELVKTCGPDEFPCNDGSCVEKARWCDSKIDCDDDSDELYCFFGSSLVKNPNRCNETLFFLCDDGECIPAVGRCDGFSSCYDNSDEVDCDAGNISALSADLTKLPTNENSEEPSMPLNPNDLKTSGQFNDPDNWMQADHASHTNISDVNKSTAYSVSGSNTSEHFSSSINLRQTGQHEVLQVNIPTNTSSVSENSKQSEVKPLVPMNHQKALEFRDVLSMINASRQEQNVTTKPTNLAPVQSFISLNKSSNTKLDNGHSLENPIIQSIGSHHSKLHADQHDSTLSKKTVSKEEDLYKGYVKLRTYNFQKAKERALQWLIDSRDSDYGWGEETARGIIALRMADYSSGKPGDAQLMSKQLHLKLFSLISRNETKRIPLGDLALYINALSASCDNPMNFHGYDLVDILRHRTNVDQESSKFVTPFVYLVLCLHNASSYTDIVKLQDMLSHWNITRIDSEAMISLATTCLAKTPKFSTVGIGLVAARRLYRKISVRGLPANIYELSLMTQALNEARINQDLWNRTDAMRRITESQNKDGSFGDILSTYYAVPTLSGRSFLAIGKVCPGKAGLDPVEVLKNGKNEKMYVHYELRFGNPLEMSQSLMIKVQKNTNFMDIMRIAATVNPTYKFKYDMNEGKPTVYSIGDKANDAERGLYWTAYTSRNSTKGLVPFEGDIRNFVPAFGEHIAFWRKPMF